ncbi:MAG: hypothetical protein HY064_06300 [Bacteroidetes bacterium]|nr:hypothetical protein [Bacteroidota bacterium]
MRSRFLLIGIFVALLFSQCRKDPPVHVDWPGWTVYTTENSSLSNNNILSVVSIQNKIFACSDPAKELVIFDGNSSSVLFVPGVNPNTDVSESTICPGTICNNRTENQVGLLSYSSSQGSSLLLYNGNWESYSQSENFPSIQIPVSMRFNQNDKVFIAANANLLQYDYFTHNSSVLEYPQIPGGDVQTLTIGLDNSVWFGTHGASAGQTNLCRLFVNDSLGIYNTLNTPLPENSIHALETDDSGKIWIATSSFLLTFYDSVWSQINLNGTPLESSQVKSIYADHFHKVWLITYGKGIISYDGINWNWYDSKNSGLPSNNVNSLRVDSNNNLWIATDNGLARFKQ